MGSFITPKKSPIAKMQMVASVMGMNAAFQFAALGPRTVQQGTLDAIELARENVGSYEAEITESRRLTDLSALGITDEQIDKYTNPYLQDVLDYSIREMEDSAERRRQERKALTSRSGNDFASSAGGPNRYQIEDDLADRTMVREIGGITAQQRAEAYRQATGLATQERGRQANAGLAYAGYGEQTQQLGYNDAGALEHVGELEGQQEQFEREHLLQQIDAYGASASNAQSSVSQYQKTSTLSQILGVSGAIVALAAPGVEAFAGNPAQSSPTIAGPTGVFSGGFSNMTSGTGSGSIPLGGPTGGFNSLSSGTGATQIPLGSLFGS